MAEMHTVDTLRSTQLPLDTRAGTRLFLSYDASKRNPYSVATRFQVLRHVRTLAKAEALFEGIVDGSVKP